MYATAKICNESINTFIEPNWYSSYKGHNSQRGCQYCAATVTLGNIGMRTNMTIHIAKFSFSSNVVYLCKISNNVTMA